MTDASGLQLSWHDYCMRDTVLITSNREFENACYKRDILSILKSWEHFKSHPMFSPEYTGAVANRVYKGDIPHAALEPMTINILKRNKLPYDPRRLGVQP